VKVKRGARQGEYTTTEVSEYFDFIKVNLFDGMVHDKSAYDTLTKNYGCSDPRISPYNILKIKSYKFERIFVFYKQTTDNIKENILEGERKLEKFLKGS
jgi:hypothetical protein